MFQTTVRLYDDPTQPPTIDAYRGTISQYIAHRWPAGIPSADFMVFKGHMSLASVCSLDTPEDWADCDGEFSISLKAPPAGFVAPFIPYIIGAVVAVVAAFVLQPAIPAVNANGRAQQSPNNSLEQRSNTPRVNQRVNDIFGDERCTFDLLSVPISEFVDNKEFESFYASIGRGQYDILDFRDGTTPLSSIQGAAASVFGPFTSPNSGDAPVYTVGGGVTGRLMTAARVNSVDGQSLDAPNQEAVSFTGATATIGGVITMPGDFTGDLSTIFDAGDILTLTDAWFIEDQPDPAPSTDYFARGVSGDYEVTSVTSNTIALNITGASNWEFAGLFEPQLWYALLDTFGEGATVRLVNPGFGWRDYNQAAQISNPSTLAVGPFVVLDNEVNVFRYNIVALNGLYRDDGTVYPMTVDLELTIERLDSSGTPTGDIAPPYTITLTGSQRDTVATTTNIDNPFLGWGTQHTMRRITDRPSTDGQNVSDEIKWRDFFTFRDDVPEQFGDITTAYVRIRATDSALRVKERVANARVVRLIPALGQAWSTTLYPLKDFASIASAIARDPRIGRLPAPAFDEQVWELERDRLIAYFGDSGMAECAHTFDDTNITFEESIQLVASACFCQAYRQGSVVRVLADLPQAVSTALYCHRNKHPGSDKRSRRFTTEKRQDGVELSYKSRTTDAMETYTLGIDGAVPSNAKEIEVQGIRTLKQAVIHARRRVNRLKYQRVTVEFDALSEARLLVPTSRIDVVNNTRYGTMDGEVTGQEGLVLKVSQPVGMTESPHSVILTRQDGSIESIPVVAASGRELTLSRVPSETVYSGYLRARTRFAFGPDAEGDKLAIRVESVQPDSIDKIRVQGVNYSDGYFEGDLQPIT
jgi:hypothetical protein